MLNVTIEIKEWDWIQAKSEFVYSGVEEDMAEWLDSVELESMQSVANYFAIPELAETP